MAEEESILAAIYEEHNGDVDMDDVEEGELVDDSPHPEVGQNCGDVNVGNQGSQSQNPNRKANKKKKKRKKRSGSAPKVTDINKFVLDSCRRLKERKSYMVYTAVGCLGISAISDMVNEVYAIQSCGGQKTADGRRYRNGGGILWNIIKAREPAAYREIMKNAREFEKQFRQPNIKQAPEKVKVDSSHGSATDGVSPLIPCENKESVAEETRKSVHERIRVPVSYEDLLVNEPSIERLKLA